MPCKRSRCCANSPLKFILKHCLLHYKQTRQRYLYLLSSTNLPFGWWALTDRRPTNSFMELLFPELKTHYRLMLNSQKLFLSTFLSILRINRIQTGMKTRRFSADRTRTCTVFPLTGYGELSWTQTNVLSQGLTPPDIICFPLHH